MQIDITGSVIKVPGHYMLKQPENEFWTRVDMSTQDLNIENSLIEPGSIFINYKPYYIYLPAWLPVSVFEGKKAGDRIEVNFECDAFRICSIHSDYKLVKVHAALEIRPMPDNFGKIKSYRQYLGALLKQLQNHIHDKYRR